jgi:hypothetical protein
VLAQPGERLASLLFDQPFLAADMATTVRASVYRGQSATYGLICRYNSNGAMYLFSVTTTGAFKLSKAGPNDETTLAQGTIPAPGLGFHQVGLACTRSGPHGERLVASLDARQLAATVDTANPITSGRIALFVNSSSVAFARFTARLTLFWA